MHVHVQENNKDRRKISLEQLVRGNTLLKLCLSARNLGTGDIKVRVDSQVYFETQISRLNPQGDTCRSPLTK